MGKSACCSKDVLAELGLDLGLLGAASSLAETPLDGPSERKREKRERDKTNSIGPREPICFPMLVWWSDTNRTAAEFSVVLIGPKKRGWGEPADSGRVACVPETFRERRRCRTVVVKSSFCFFLSSFLCLRFLGVYVSAIPVPFAPRSVRMQASSILITLLQLRMHLRVIPPRLAFRLIRYA